MGDNSILVMRFTILSISFAFKKIQSQAEKDCFTGTTPKDDTFPSTIWTSSYLTECTLLASLPIPRQQDSRGLHI